MRHTLLASVLALLAGAVSPARATLVKQDFLTVGDGLIVYDTVTNLQWLTPVYTKGHLYNDAFVQSINSTYGFRYATATEATNLINDNFGNPPSAFPGTPAGYTAAIAFLNLFGVAQNVTCGSSPCPRTQGLTSDSSAPGNHLGFGMIAYGTNGYSMLNNPWPDTFADGQMGSYLVRAASVAATPEPGTLALLGAGLLFCVRRRCR